MKIDPRIVASHTELTGIRRDFHAHPELGYEEFRTSEIVARKLKEYGCDVVTGIAKTGVVGTLRVGNSPRAIGLRADMDCLPMDELNTFAHKSTHKGRMHGCGHDGHTTMLLGAAKYLSATRNFEGAVHFFFQPAEEGGGGGKAMIDDGLFEKFPCDAVFAIHNKPGLPLGMIATKPGALLAAADRWDLRITGKGGHAAHPHLSLDPLIVAANLVLSLQTIVSRNMDPFASSVVTVGFVKGGSAYNVIPTDAHVGGTTRTTTPEARKLIEARIREICEGAARMYGVKIDVEYRLGYPPTINNAQRAAFAIDVAAGVCGPHGVRDNVQASMGAEDFSYMLEKVPGAMVWLGNGGEDGNGAGLHNSRYDFNDMAIPFGVSFFVNTVERFLGE